MGIFCNPANFSLRVTNSSKIKLVRSLGELRNSWKLFRRKGLCCSLHIQILQIVVDG